MISFDEALAIIRDAAKPLGSERIALADAAERVLAAPVIARIDSPRSNVSAMDGYAVRDDDRVAWRRVGVSYPGTPFTGTTDIGECVRIFTGAPLPQGLDRVVIQEMVETEGEAVRLVGAHSEGRHIRLRASDFAIGELLVPAGRRLDPRALVAVAGADQADVEVHRRPMVAVIGSGDELVDPGSAQADPSTIPDSLSLALAASVVRWGGQGGGREQVRDDQAAFTAAAQRTLARADLVVVTGGASVGEKDYAKSVFGALGLELLFSKVAMKPGKPVWCGRIGERLVLGLPGNPTSAMVTARLFLAPLLAGLSGEECGLAWKRSTLLAPLDPCGDRETFVRARMEEGGVVPLDDQVSGAQRALVDADVLIRRRPGSPALAAGSAVDILGF